jgi:hypothetical protein
LENNSKSSSNSKNFSRNPTRKCLRKRVINRNKTKLRRLTSISNSWKKRRPIQSAAVVAGESPNAKTMTSTVMPHLIMV